MVKLFAIGVKSRLNGDFDSVGMLLKQLFVHHDLVLKALLQPY